MFCPSLFGQNMISNGDFSQITGTQTCTYWRGGIAGREISAAYVLDWHSTLDSIKQGLNTGWLSHYCQVSYQTDRNFAKPGNFPFPSTKSGLGMAQISLFQSRLHPLLSRAFISQILQDTLIAGEEYCIEFYTRPFKWSTAFSNNIGVYFTADSLDYYAYQQNITPHLEAAHVISDTTVWTRVKGSFVAVGNEHYINIGNFRSDSASTMIPSGFPSDPWFYP